VGVIFLGWLNKSRQSGRRGIRNKLLKNVRGFFTDGKAFFINSDGRTARLFRVRILTTAISVLDHTSKVTVVSLMSLIVETEDM
jgi:hypothetical protein